MKQQQLEGFRISPQQKSLWLCQQKKPSPYYKTHGTIFIEGTLVEERLIAALETVIKRQEILRTIFYQPPGINLPLQVVIDSNNCPLKRYDLQNLSPQKQLAGLEEISHQMFQKPFSLEKYPLWHLSLVQLSKQQHWLIISVPGLCIDRFSLNYLMREISDCYAAGVNFEDEPLQYADFSQWQNELLESEDTAEGRAFWQQQDLSVRRPLTLPWQNINADSGNVNCQPNWVSLTLNSDEVQKIEQFVQESQIPTQIFFLTCFLILLGRMTHQSEIRIGVEYEGRQYQELEQTIGLMAKYLPFSTDLDSTVPFNQLCQQVAQKSQDLAKWQDYFVAANREQYFLGNAISFEADLETEKRITNPSINWYVVKTFSFLYPYQLKLCCVRYGNEIEIEFHYNTTNAFLEKVIEDWLKQYYTLLTSAIANFSSPIQELEILSDEDKEQILFQFNPYLEAEFKSDRFEYQCIHHLFEKQVKQTPEQIAVVGNGEKLTYQQLNTRANQLAHYLQQQGIGANERVAIFLERSSSMIIALMSILKAGGAYVPIEPTLPPERVKLILTDSQAKMLIAQQSLRSQIPAYSGRIIELEKNGEAIAKNSQSNLDIQVNPENLVYVIYTSGSTGTPKGVAIEHRQLRNYLEGITERLNLPQNASYALMSTFGADLGNTVIFPSLCSGGCLHIISQDKITDPVALGAYFEEQGGIDCLKIVPSHLRALLKDLPHPAQILPRKRLVLGGEALSWELVEQVQRLAPKCQILNHYGPTETTVGVLTYAVPTEELVKNSATVPLGQPLPNTQIFILDEQLSPVPLGYPGELYIGGDNLARGYLNQPNLSPESFNAHPFNQKLRIKIKNQRLKIKITRGQCFEREAKFKLKRTDRLSDSHKKHKFTLSERLYRTGDLARYLPDGNIEFLGRLDHQVKLHGFRIELGEIETLLNRYPGVAETVVMVSEKTTNEKRLVAYILPENNINPSTLKELRHYMQEKLPEYMIPAAFMILERLPLTANGKLDRHALPTVTTTRSDLDSLYIAPRTSQEQILAKIWAEVLGIEKVGVKDNFFELGGDSILSIQIVARAKAAGLKLTPMQLFHHQTIAELASISQSDLPQIQLGEVTGQVPLTPIQHWFFQQKLPNPDHWNMSMLVETPANLRQDYLETVIQALSTHHHGLGLYFELTESVWEQRYGDGLAKVPCLYVDLAAIPEAELESIISTKASEIQSSLNLATPPLMKVVWFDCGRDKPGRLLVVVHHLLIDGVSWRIWLEDLETAYKQIEAGNQIQLPAQTTSFKYWSQKLTEYAAGIRVFQELDYWLGQAQGQATPLPQDFNQGTNSFAAAQTITVTLDSNHTQLALQQVSSIDNTQINDLLLTALLLAYNSWTGENSLLVELEGHGRESLFEEVDLSRTLGWFTTHFPQLLKCEPGTDTAITLQSVKAQLHACPNHGIGYGLLRYLCNNQEIMTKLQNLPRPEICFNYLGQFNQFSSLFPIVMEHRGQERNGSSQRTHEINIDAMVINGQMHFEWTYSIHRYQAATIEKLAKNMLTALKRLIEELLNSAQTLPMSPELGLTKLQLAQIQHKFGAIADIYPLSPLQQGILFHSRYHQESNLYCQQKLFTLQGSLKVAAFKEAWQIVVNRHDSLKTAFVWENLTNPLQVVPIAIAIPWTEHNWLDLSPTEQEQQLDIYLKQDFQRGFALDNPPLMRMTLFQIAINQYQLLWSHHHLLLDGWCNSVIFKEVFTVYEALCQEKNINLPPSPLYKDYITWLQQQDNSQAQAFWYQALNGVKAPTRWGIEQTASKFNEHQKEYAYQEFELSPQTTAALNTWAKSHRLTFNTLIQGSFALLLSRYSGEEDVIFGGTVSGRPPELEGVESMVGLLINTLPVRVQVCGEVSLLDWLQQIQQQQIQRLEYQYNSLVQIQQWSQLNGGTPLFESFIAVENYPVDASLLSGEGSLKILGCRSSSRTNYSLSVTVELDSSVLVVISYDSQQFEMTAISQILQQFKEVLETLPAYGRTCLSDIPIATTTETQQLIDSFNADLD